MGSALRARRRMTGQRGGPIGPDAGIHLRRRVEIIGVNPFVWISRATAAQLAPGRRGPIPVLARVNGRPAEPHRINLMPAATGEYRLYLNGIVRAASDTSVGDVVDVWLDLDAEYHGGPAHPFPRALRAGVRPGTIAGRTWGSLAPSRQKEVLRYLAMLRGADARKRNIEKAVRVLAGSRERFLGRVWTVDVDLARRRASGRRRGTTGSTGR